MTATNQTPLSTTEPTPNPATLRTTPNPTTLSAEPNHTLRAEIERVILTDHFKERFAERIAKTKRMEYFTQAAYDDGLRLAEITNKKASKWLTKIIEAYGNEAEPRIYKGYVYWFSVLYKTAITVYRIPNEFKKCFNN